MSETEIKRDEIINAMKIQINAELVKILNEINDITCLDGVPYNKVDANLVWDLDEVTRELDRYRQKLDEINGVKGGMYPWA